MQEELAVLEAALPSDLPHQAGDKLKLAKEGAGILNNLLKRHGDPSAIVPLLQPIGNLLSNPFFVWLISCRP